MHNLVKIDNMNGLARDISSHAVVATSKEAFDDYRKRKALASQRADEMKRQQEEIDKLKQDIGEIKNMLQELIKR